eukprot:tig00000342_g24225.t1
MTPDGALDGASKLNISTSALESEKEVAEVIAVVNEAYRAEDFFKKRLRTDREEIEQLKSAAGGRFLLLRVGGDGPVVGSVYVACEGHHGHLQMLAVHPSMQRRGCAQRLIQAAEEYAVSQGCSVMDLMMVDVRADAVEDLYLRTGYRRTGVTEPFVDESKVKYPVNFVEMQKVLKAPSTCTVPAGNEPPPQR